VFLTPTELLELTGYKKPALQRRWLVEHGYRFDVRAVVLTAAKRSSLSVVYLVLSLTGRPWSRLRCRWDVTARATSISRRS
jgi:hypothetical protein